MVAPGKSLRTNEGRWEGLANREYSDATIPLLFLPSLIPTFLFLSILPSFFISYTFQKSSQAVTLCQYNGDTVSPSSKLTLSAVIRGSLFSASMTKLISLVISFFFIFFSLASFSYNRNYTEHAQSETRRSVNTRTEASCSCY